MKKQAYNPYLPSYEYVPDGEPHVFGDRVYLYGSHDRCGSAGFCLNDYVCYSASVYDLTDWKYEGVILKKTQDPRNQNIPEDAPEQPRKFGVEPKKPEDLNPRGIHAQWAPDVVKGPDGRYYLYYCLDWLPEIAVAVCDTPAGQYEFLGLVCHADGTPLGTREGDLIQFDPGIFIDDDGEIYLYSGNAPKLPERFATEPNKGSQVMTLESDMLTLKTEPRHLLPDVREAVGTEFDGHAFFEASSIRKIGDTYYFVYSSVVSSELCYATSKYPDRDYHFGGTLVDIGDIGIDGRTKEQPLNALGNTHGGMEQINGQWYIFYHRQTNRTNFSRQGCAEKITIEPDGSIRQVEVTSCGLNDGPLMAHGTYPARICCQLTGEKWNVYSNPETMKMDFPFLTQDLPDIEPGSPESMLESILPVQYITNIQNGTVIGYKYFSYDGPKKLSLLVRGSAQGIFKVSVTRTGETIGVIPVVVCKKEFVKVSAEIPFEAETAGLYLSYQGDGALDLATFTFE
ncbi:MAG: family 43 glycosylhydrolase [Lachnospiraceae bacterium]|nr:family 43 glycosylhydrolase [Cuneatibacter sp.]MDD6455284.1 family 43 glycosylhydrolase [Lachnospiraceae bacterium]